MLLLGKTFAPCTSARRRFDSDLWK